MKVKVDETCSRGTESGFSLPWWEGNGSGEVGFQSSLWGIPERRQSQQDHEMNDQSTYPGRWTFGQQDHEPGKQQSLLSQWCLPAPALSPPPYHPPCKIIHKHERKRKYMLLFTASPVLAEPHFYTWAKSALYRINPKVKNKSAALVSSLPLKIPWALPQRIVIQRLLWQQVACIESKRSAVLILRPSVDEKDSINVLCIK